VWLRARLDRRHLLPEGASPDTVVPSAGVLDRVLLVI